MSDEELTPPVEATEQTEQELAPPVESSADAGATDLAAGLDIGGAAADVDADDLVERPDPVIRGKIDKFGNAWGTGRRKTAVARVCMKDGTGKITVNKREFAEYFVIERDRELIERVLVATEMKGKVDIDIRVNGGGPTGQTGAVVLGVARALQAKNPGLHHMLHAGSFLTRDGRMVERKKYGFKKARRSFQFSKR